MSIQCFFTAAVMKDLCLYCCLTMTGKFLEDNNHQIAMQLIWHVKAFTITGESSKVCWQFCSWNSGLGAVNIWYCIAASGPARSQKIFIQTQIWIFTAVNLGIINRHFLSCWNRCHENKNFYFILLKSCPFVFHAVFCLLSSTFFSFFFLQKQNN